MADFSEVDGYVRLVDDEVSQVACQDAIDHLTVRTCVLVCCRQLERGKHMHIYTPTPVSMHIHTDTHSDTHARTNTHTQTNTYPCRHTRTPSQYLC